MAQTVLALDELLQALAGYIGDDKDKARELALAIHRNDATQPIAQTLINKGVGKRAQQIQTQVVELESKVAQLKEEIEAKDEEIQQIRGEQPQWGKRLEETERRLTQKVKDTEGQLEQERAARREDRLKLFRDRFVQKLGPGTQVDKDWAETVLATKYADRFRLTEQGDLEVLEIGETTPYDAAGDPEKAIDLLVQDVLRTVPGKYRVLGAPSGGGGTNGAAPEVRPRTPEQVQESQRRAVGYARP